MTRKLEIHATENGEVVGIYIGDGRRAASWARRANPEATITAKEPTDKIWKAPDASWGSGNRTTPQSKP